ncbi:ABC transporter permease [Streptomyces sp. TLI_171]|uniref:ABC transporter permease n=1 Tax=Streptomyces sp. TLI_171 TaxID=1938859 RepID=UPI000C1A7DB6|nr:ABC transporter permease [Streptomyces sp. TLI_171]RKE21028.1 putative ABC transport system permease protein [Streptomyces sp. TLI_171]
MRLTAWRATLRIARRDAMRAKGRSALVLAMIALPVLGVAGADVTIRSAQLEPAEVAARTIGAADAKIEMSIRGGSLTQAPDPGDGTIGDRPEPGKPQTAEQKRSADTDPAKLVTELLPGAVLKPLPAGPRTTASTKEGRMTVQTTEVDLADPVWRGMIDVVRGTVPAKADEIAATQAFLDQSGLRLGDRTSVRGLESTPFTITAVAEYPSRLKETDLLARPGALIAPLAQAHPEQAGDSMGGDAWLVTLPAGTTVDWPTVLDLNKYGFAVTSRAVLLDPPARSEVPFYNDQRFGSSSPDKVAVAVAATVVGMALLEIVLLAGPAFAVGARRSRRQLGLLAAGGGDRGHVRAVVLGGGAVLGVTGALIGLVLAVVLVAVFRTSAEDFAGRRFGHFDLQPLDLLAIAAVGLVTGLLAAVVPAVQAARQDVVAALTGRGGIKPASRIVAVIGAVLVAGGTALALLCAAAGTAVIPGLLGGSVLAEIGMLLCTPLLIGLFGRLGRYLPLSPRLALRDSVRHRGRTAPAVAAVMAAVAGAVAVGIYTTSSTEESRRNYLPQAPANTVSLYAGWGPTADQTRLPVMRDAIEGAMPGLGERADVSSLTQAGGCAPGASCGYVEAVLPESKRCPADLARTPEEYERAHNDPRCAVRNDRRSFQTGLFGDTVVGDSALLHTLFGLHDPAAEQALAAGKVLVFWPDYVQDGKVVLEVTAPYRDNAVNSNDQPERHQVLVDAVEVHAPTPYGTAVMSRQTAERAGLGTREAGSLWLPAATPSGKAIQKATGSLAKLDDNAMLQVERGFQPDTDLVTLGLTVFAALVALGAAGIATGLAAADSQQDLATLAAVGANGGIRRRLSGFQCGVIAAMGAVLGLLCGAVPAIALRLFQAQNRVTYSGHGSVEKQPFDPVIAVPWTELGLMLVGLPAVAVLLAALLTRSRLGLTRRTA